MVYDKETKMKFNFSFTLRIWILIVAILLSLLAIVGSPINLFQQGILVTGVEQNSTSFESGLRQGQIIIEVDGNLIKDIDDYSMALLGKFDSGENVKTIIKTKDSEIILFSNNTPEITISEIPKTNIKTGLDISGGARALIKAQDKEISSTEASELKEVINNRLNVYGIEDVKVSSISDLSGNYYVRIEIAGATPEGLKELISQQGKFEAKIGDEVVFIGGKDITSVSRSGQDALVESCSQQADNSYFCNFRFSVYLNEEAAKRHADITKELDVNYTGGGVYLSKKLDLFLDDKLVDSLFISEGLKGRVTTQISITGSSTGFTQEEANKNARDEMNKLHTILITGSLPYQLEVVSLDTISSSIGKNFVSSIIKVGLIALLSVSLLIFLRYKKIKLSLALLLTSISEIVIILGIASLIKWNLDLPSIAGILATIGTGIDQQIIIMDESKEPSSSLQQSLKRAFMIILGAYLTVTAALLPLYWAAAGFFKGFALTTIIGVTAGILITRPAFSDIIKKIKEREE